MPYTIFKIPKRRGGFRTIEAPNETLKKQQQDLIPILQKTFKVSPFAHAFAPYKNIATMAMSHVGKRWIVAIDIEDFFPSITARMITKTAKFIDTQLKDNNFGAYHRELDKSIKDFINLYKLYDICFHDFGDGKGLRLPQGAPTSPILSNVLLNALDWKLARRFFTYKCDYSRYADDLVISGDSKKDVLRCMSIAKKALSDLGLKVNESKTKIMHRSKRQLVCGVVVNEKLNLPRKFRKNLRAEVHQQKGGELREETKGRMAFKEMVLNNKKETWSSVGAIRALLLINKLEEASKIKY